MHSTLHMLSVYIKTEVYLKCSPDVPTAQIFVNYLQDFGSMHIGYLDKGKALALHCAMQKNKNKKQ